MNIIGFVPEELLILVVCLYFIGMFIKRTSLISDAYIPFLLIPLSIAAASFKIGFDIDSVLVGIICASIAVLGENIKKQTVEIINKK